MTDQEKISRHDILSDIRTRIGGCFGCADGKFEGHPADEERAKELRKLADKSKISIKEITEIVLGYLYENGFDSNHIKIEMEKAAKFFGTKLQ